MIQQSCFGILLYICVVQGCWWLLLAFMLQFRYFLLA